MKTGFNAESAGNILEQIIFGGISMLTRRLAMAMLIMSIIPSFAGSPEASAQNGEVRREARQREGGEGRGGGGGQRQAEEEDIEAPVDLTKFPGVGSIDAWKTSVPEFRAGMEQMKLRKWDDAIAHFRASITLYEYQPKAFLEIGKAIEAKDGLVTDAEKAYRQCVKLNNQSWAGWKGLANNLFVQKRYDEAREAVSNALNLNPPPKARQHMDKLVQMIDSGQRDANTTGQNTGQ